MEGVSSDEMASPILGAYGMLGNGDSSRFATTKEGKKKREVAIGLWEEFNAPKRNATGCLWVLFYPSPIHVRPKFS